MIPLLFDLLCFHLPQYPDPYSFLQLELGPSAGVYDEIRDLDPTPLQRHCTEIDLSEKKVARARACVRQSPEVSACSAPGGEISLVFPGAPLSSSASRE